MAITTGGQMNARYDGVRAREDAEVAGAPAKDPERSEPGVAQPVGLRPIDGPSPSGRSSPDPSRSPSELEQRLCRLERQLRWLKLGVATLIAGFGWFLYTGTISPHDMVRETLTESQELKLVDSDGTPRLFLRMYSRVPVLQILDKNGKPRMSLGLRYDETPFFDLSDRSGRKRVSLEMTADDQPRLEILDAQGNAKVRF